MRPAVIVALLPSLYVAFAAAPSASKTLSAGETTERQVRASKEHVAVAVEPSGHISEAPVEKVEATTRAQEAKLHKAEAPEALQEKTAEVKEIKEVKAPAPEVHETQAKATETVPIEKTVNLEKVAFYVGTAEAEESWKSAFFFFAALVLIVVLAGAFVFRMKQKQDEQKEALRTSQASSSASKNSAHLNDSSSTSDSGEKIAMLFDRVRQSLEDLGHDKQAPPAAPGDVAGGKGGQI